MAIHLAYFYEMHEADHCHKTYISIYSSIHNAYYVIS